MKPQDAFEKELLPRIRAALERGAARGDMWERDAQARGNIVANAEHVIGIHVSGRLGEALQLLDYGDIDQAYDKLASAVGYMAVLIGQTKALDN